MKIRLAKKIMKQQAKNKVSFYWFKHWFNFIIKNGKIDHRITKAISLTSKKEILERKKKKHGTF